MNTTPCGPIPEMVSIEAEAPKFQKYSASGPLSNPEKTTVSEGQDVIGDTEILELVPHSGSSQSTNPF